MFRRRSKFARLFVLVLVLSSVACSEFPELVSLADNTSNDFTTQSCIAGEVGIAATTQITATVPASRITACEQFLDIPQRISLFGISRDLLLLYSVLRT
jgi:hypothetical protein